MYHFRDVVSIFSCPAQYTVATFSEELLDDISIRQLASEFLISLAFMFSTRHRRATARNVEPCYGSVGDLELGFLWIVAYACSQDFDWGRFG